MAANGLSDCTVIGVDDALGRSLATELSRLGASVRAWAPAPRRESAQLGDVSVLRGPVDDARVIEEAIGSASLVVHAQIDDRPGATYDELAPINLDLSKRVFEAASRRGVATVVLVSHGRLYARANHYVDEQAEIEPSDAPGRSLYDLEILLRGLANRGPSAPRLVVLRRARLYGHDEPPAQAPWWAVPPLLGLYFELVPGLAGGPRSQWLHVHDLARAIAHVAQLEDPDRVSTFNVCDQTPLTIGEFLNGVIEGYGAPLGVKVPYPSPAFVRRLLPVADRPPIRSLASGLLSRLWRSATEGHADAAEPDFTRAGLWGLADDLLMAGDRLAATGFELEYADSRTVLAEVISDWKRRGLVPGELRRGAGPKVDKEGPDGRGLGSRFAETMRGSVRRQEGGSALSIAFTVELSTAGVRLPVTDHTWNLDGELTIEDWTGGPTPISGTLEVAPIGKRQLIYEFGFTDRDGHTFRLKGVKRIRVLDLKRSLTEMTVEILDEQGALVATGEMTFDLRHDLGAFLRSFGVTRKGAADRARSQLSGR